MTCFRPVTSSIDPIKTTPSGKALIHYGKHIVGAEPIKLPCGGCLGCRLDKAREWAVRILHEASLYEDNTFLTLTYSDEYLPKNGSLNHEHFQLFMKALRQRLSHKKLRFYMCGEYGEKFRRPHYHAIIFNHHFDDMTEIYEGSKRFYSPWLENIWFRGFNDIGTVTLDSAMYVAGYVTKKITGKKANEHYTRVDQDTLESHRVEPEYNKQSNRPGIGKDYMENYKSDIFPHGYIDVPTKSGLQKFKTPKYYENIYKKYNPEEWESIRQARRLLMEEKAENYTPERLKVKEKLAKARHASYKRNYEEN